MYWLCSCSGGEFIPGKFDRDFVALYEYLKNVCDGALPVVSPAQTRDVPLDEREAAVSAALNEQSNSKIVVKLVSAIEIMYSSSIMRKLGVKAFL